MGDTMSTRSALDSRQPSTSGTTPARSRRRFFARVGAAVAGIALLFRPGSSAAHAQRQRIHLHDCRIAGSHYYECQRAHAWLEPGDRLDLRREPSNRHDWRAVEVYWHGLKLGYLPRRDNLAAASLLDRGHRVDAELLAIDAPGEHWEPLQLRLYLELVS
jgi:hypothetical protein